MIKTMVDLNHPHQRLTNASVNTVGDQLGKRPTTSELNRSMIQQNSKSGNIAQQFNVQIHEMNKTQKKLITLQNQQQKLSDSIQKKRLQKRGD